MIEHIWSILCESASLDIESGHISLFNAIDSLVVYGDPSQLARIPVSFEIVSNWTRSEETPGMKGKMRIFLCRPNGECKQQLELPIDLAENIFHRTRVHSSGMVLMGPGIYKFVVELLDEGADSWQKVASVPLHVSFEPIEVQAQPTGLGPQE